MTRFAFARWLVQRKASNSTSQRLCRTHTKPCVRVTAGRVYRLLIMDLFRYHPLKTLLFIHLSHALYLVHFVGSTLVDVDYNLFSMCF